MHTVRQKLTNRRGESLAEVLVAMLIVALAVLLLAGMVTAAGGINAQTRARDTRFYAELSAAEQHEPYGAAAGLAYGISIQVQRPTTDPASGEATWSPAGDALSVPVTLYGGEDLLSYGRPPAAGGGSGG